MLEQTVIIASLIHRYEFVLEQPNAEVVCWVFRISWKLTLAALV